MGGLHPAVALGGLEQDPLALLEGAVPAVVHDRGEVHEHVVAAVVGRDEPEALLGVEEPDGALDGAAGAAGGAGRLAARGLAAGPAVVTPVVAPVVTAGLAGGGAVDLDRRAAQRAHPVGLQPALTGAGLVLHPGTLVEAAEPTAVLDGREVHEDVLTAVVGADEPEPLLRVEPLHEPLRHALLLLPAAPWHRCAVLQRPTSGAQSSGGCTGRGASTRHSAPIAARR